MDKKQEGCVVSDNGECVKIFVVVGTTVTSSGRVELTYDKLTTDVRMTSGLTTTLFFCFEISL